LTIGFNISSVSRASPRGEPLTFLSDGVVEARNAAGDLFGFECTLQLSSAGAQAIAQAAVDFGQDDDITVLTLTRQGVRDASTAHCAAPILSPA
jgi:serine phosphatase RsbU (regulator of sigma subunit)